MGDVPFSGVMSSDKCETVEESCDPRSKDRGTSRDSPPQQAGIASRGIL